MPTEKRKKTAIRKLAAPKKPLCKVQDKKDGQILPSEEQVPAMIFRLGIMALSRLELLSRSEDERIALAASQEILNRAFGKITTTQPRPERTIDSTPIIEVINYADWLEQQMEKDNA